MLQNSNTSSSSESDQSIVSVANSKSEKIESESVENIIKELNRVETPSPVRDRVADRIILNVSMNLTKQLFAQVQRMSSEETVLLKKKYFVNFFIYLIAMVKLLRLTV